MCGALAVAPGAVLSPSRARAVCPAVLAGVLPCAHLLLQGSGGLVAAPHLVGVGKPGAAEMRRGHGWCRAYRWVVVALAPAGFEAELRVPRP